MVAPTLILPPPPSNSNARAILHTIDSKSLFRASLVLNKQANDVAKVIDCYIRDEDPSYRSLVFEYIDEVVQRERAAGLAVRRAGASSGAGGADSDEEGEDRRPVTTPQLEGLKATLLQRFSDLSKINQDRVRLSMWPSSGGGGGRGGEGGVGWGRVPLGRSWRVGVRMPTCGPVCRVYGASL
jgi:hypothetical protein